MIADAGTRINEDQKSSATDAHRTTQITRNKFHEKQLKKPPIVFSFSVFICVVLCASVAKILRFLLALGGSFPF